MAFNQTQRPALGQIAKIGEIYNAHSDEFCNVSIFKKEIPSGCLETTDAHETTFHYLASDDLSDKFNKLEIKSGLQASILCDLVPLNGSALFLKDVKKSARAITSSLVYKTVTSKETLNLFHEDLKESFSLDVLLKSPGTHVVTGRLWGANCILSCIYNGKNTSATLNKVQGHFSSLLNKLTKIIDGKAETDFEWSEDNIPSVGYDFEIKFYGDVNFNENLPVTLDESLTMMKKLPLLLQTCNDGKGKPVMYTLCPIQDVITYFKIQVGSQVIYKSVEESILISLVRQFQEIQLGLQKIEDIYQDLIKYPTCAPSEKIKEIENVRNELQRMECEMKENFKKNLIKVRSGECDASEILNYLETLNKSEFAPVNINQLVHSYNPMMEEVAFIKEVKDCGGMYIGNGSRYKHLFAEGSYGTVFIFYFTSKSMEVKQVFNKNKKKFMEEMKNGNGKYLFYALDCDFHPVMADSSKECFIQVRKGSRVVLDDLVAYSEKLASMPMVCSEKPYKQFIRKPNKRGSLSIPCTGTACPKHVVYSWHCFVCHQEVEYGFDKYVYCQCGKVLIFSLLFKCPDENHREFTRPKMPTLHQLILTLSPYKELNILILGETGVGKSTWINAFQNNVAHKNLTEAETHDLLSLVPTSFTVVDSNFDEIEVKTGFDSNEVAKKGQSATQECRVYSFPFKDCNNTDMIIRLIDTPGIGDTRGFAQDRRNFKNILQTIQLFDEIHGICILMKPNNAKVTVMFNFCIKELLVHLHHEAIENIVFCFTNSRSTFYRPGDTLQSLKVILKDSKIPLNLKEKMYCFDSEAFRFLAAIKNNPPVSFSEEERRDFSLSWEKSAKETHRLLLHIMSIKPHAVKSTINLNNARSLIFKLTTTIADILKNIQKNKQIILNEMSKINEDEDFLNNLQDKRFVNKSHLQLEKLEFPQTVCTNKDCVEFEMGLHGERNTLYTQVCHEPCKLWRHSDGDLTGTYKFSCCPAFSLFGICKKCKHSYSEHMHRFYVSKYVIKEEEDENIKGIFEDKLPQKEAKERLIGVKQKEILELEIEHKEIQNASAKFAYFLKTSAITPYNDSLKEYLEHLIRQEQQNVESGCRQDMLQALRKDLSDYEGEKNALERAITSGEDNAGFNTPEDITKIVEKLKNLKHSGKSIRDAIKMVSYATENDLELTTTGNNVRVAGEKQAAHGKYYIGSKDFHQGINNFYNKTKSMFSGMSSAATQFLKKDKQGIEPQTYKEDLAQQSQVFWV